MIVFIVLMFSTLIAHADLYTDTYDEYKKFGDGRPLLDFCDDLSKKIERALQANNQPLATNLSRFLSVTVATGLGKGFRQATTQEIKRLKEISLKSTLIFSSLKDNEERKAQFYKAMTNISENIAGKQNQLEELFYISYHFLGLEPELDSELKKASDLPDFTKEFKHKNDPAYFKHLTEGLPKIDTNVYINAADGLKNNPTPEQKRMASNILSQSVFFIRKKVNLTQSEQDLKNAETNLESIILQILLDLSALDKTPPKFIDTEGTIIQRLNAAGQSQGITVDGAKKALSNITEEIKKIKENQQRAVQAVRQRLGEEDAQTAANLKGNTADNKVERLIKGAEIKKKDHDLGGPDAEQENTIQEKIKETLGILETVPNPSGEDRADKLLKILKPTKTFTEVLAKLEEAKNDQDVQVSQRRKKDSTKPAGPTSNPLPSNITIDSTENLQGLDASQAGANVSVPIEDFIRNDQALNDLEALVDSLDTGVVPIKNLAGDQVTVVMKVFVLENGGNTKKPVYYKLSVASRVFDKLNALQKDFYFWCVDDKFFAISKTDKSVPIKDLTGNARQSKGSTINDIQKAHALSTS